MHRCGRLSLRLRGFDYRSSGMYFVTICTAKKEDWFGEIVNGNMRLSKEGKIALACWHEIPKHFPFVQLDAFVVMPNHVHGLITIDGCSGMQLHAATTKTINRHFGKPIAKSLSMIINIYKGAVTRQIGQLYQEPIRLWQHNFHDHIIRDEEELRAIRTYILNNPRNWENDACKT